MKHLAAMSLDGCGVNFLDEWSVPGFSLNVCVCIGFSAKLRYGQSWCILACISMDTQPTDIKFATALDLRWYLVMVARVMQYYDWFCHISFHLFVG